MRWEEEHRSGPLQSGRERAVLVCRAVHITSKVLHRPRPMLVLEGGVIDVGVWGVATKSGSGAHEEEALAVRGKGGTEVVEHGVDLGTNIHRRSPRIATMLTGRHPYVQATQPSRTVRGHEELLPSAEMKGHPSSDDELKSGCAPGGALSMSSACDQGSERPPASAVTELEATMTHARAMVGPDRIVLCLLFLLIRLPLS